MHRLLLFSLPALFAAVAPATQAASVSKCVDEAGNISYERHCPPGSTTLEERDYRVNRDDGGADAAPSGPLTLYVVPDCDSCTQVKEFLAVRGISVTERDVNDNQDLQDELEEVAGELRVPVLVIGDDVVKGYDRGALLDSLAQAGYPTEPDLE